jgi:hypothetical protein
MFAEGSGLPTGRTSRVFKYTNTFQISKAAVEVTGSEATNTMYFEPIPNVQGAFYLKERQDTMQRWEESVDALLLFGQQVDNVKVSDSYLGRDKKILGTEGLLSFCQNYGYNYAYSGGGGLTLADFDTITSIYVAERIGTKDISFASGHSLYLTTENLLTSLYNADFSFSLTKSFFKGNDFGTLNASDFQTYIGFQGVHKGGFNFGFSKIPTFDDPTSVGLSTYGHTNSAIVLPKTFMTNKKSKDRTPTFGYEYKVSEDGSYSRELVVDVMRGAGSIGNTTAVNGRDTTIYSMVSEIAAHCAGANHCIYFKP